MVTLTEGDDVLVELIEGDVTINALGGNDHVAITNQDMVNGSPEDYGTVTVHAGAGDDEVNVYWAAYADLYGEDGDDKLLINYFSGEAHGGAGDDTIEADVGSENAYIYGDDGNDTLSVASERVGAAYGGNGDDYIWFSTQGFGGNGSDFVNGSRAEGNDGDDITLAWISAQGGEGSDYVDGEIADGGNGNDIVHTRSEAEGGAGRDVFFPLLIIRVPWQTDYLSDTPIVDFEPGVDVMVVPFPVHVVAAFTGQANEVVSNGTDTSFDLNGDGIGEFMLPATGPLTQDDFVTIILDEPVYLVDTDDVAAGTAANEFAFGGLGDDTLTGNGGKDVLHGSFGDDTLNGNSGDDLLVGNAGMDRLYGGSGDDELDGGDGDDGMSGSAGNDFAYGGAGADIIAGGAGMDRLLGEGGNDRINGGADDDTVSGGEGNDTLRGDAGNDVITGDDGNDVTYGGLGKDVLTGGSGADRFAFGAGDSKAGGSFRDIVTDFTVGVDKLDLSALRISDYSQISFKAVGSGLIVYADTDGNGFDYSDFAVQLTGVSALEASDFILV